MSIDIGPKPIKGEAEYHHQRGSRKQGSSNAGAIFAFLVLCVAFVAFLVIRNLVIDFWESLPF